MGGPDVPGTHIATGFWDLPALAAPQGPPSARMSFRWFSSGTSAGSLPADCHDEKALRR